MPPFNNLMEVFKLLDKSNCRQCNEPTCLAFAAAVFKGQRRLDECPHLDSGIIERFVVKTAKPENTDREMDETVELLKRKIATMSFSSSLAEKLGARFSGEKLTLKILGKDFSVDSKGNLSSDIHMHRWVTVPVLSYMINSAGIPVLEKLGSVQGT